MDDVGLAGLPVPDPVVRAATPADAAELVRLFCLSATELADRKGAWLWERADSPFADPTVAAEAVTSEPWVTAVGMIDDVIVGFLVAQQSTMHRDGEIGMVRGLYVETGARGVGVADALIGYAIDRFKEAGCVGVDSWALPGERETKNFYEAHGFTARTITVHHSFIEPKHASRTVGLGSADRNPAPKADEAGTSDSPDAT